MNEQTVTLGGIFSIIRKSKWIIISLATVAGVSAYLVSSILISPTYEASTQVLISPKQAEGMTLDNNQIQTSVALINTYRVIIQSPAILEEVQKNVVGSPENIKGLISVNSEQNSQVINIGVQYSNPVIAAEIANEISNVFSKEVKELMSVDNVKILSDANIPVFPVKPNILINTIIATTLGVLIGIMISFLKVMLDRRIKTEQDVEIVLDLPVLGTIPIIDKMNLNSSEKTVLKGEEIHV